jgi:hypothetical protein
MRTGREEPQGRRWWGRVPAAVTVTAEPQPPHVVEARLRRLLAGAGERPVAKRPR